MPCQKKRVNKEQENTPPGRISDCPPQDESYSLERLPHIDPRISDGSKVISQQIECLCTSSSLIGRCLLNLRLTSLLDPIELLQIGQLVALRGQQS